MDNTDSAMTLLPQHTNTYPTSITPSNSYHISHAPLALTPFSPSIQLIKKRRLLISPITCPPMVLPTKSALISTRTQSTSRTADLAYGSCTMQMKCRLGATQENAALMQEQTSFLQFTSMARSFGKLSCQ